MRAVEGMAQPSVHRNRLNRWAALITANGMLAVLVAVDVLHLYSAFEPPDEASSYLWSLPYYGFIFALAMLLLVVGVRPKVELFADRVVLHNMFRTVSIPRTRIEQVDQSLKHLRVQAAGVWYTAWGLERWTVEAALDRPGAGQELLSELLERPVAEAVVGEEVAVYRRRIRPAEAAVCAPWLLYAGSAAVSTAVGWSPAPFA